MAYLSFLTFAKRTLTPVRDCTHLSVIRNTPAVTNPT